MFHMLSCFNLKPHVGIEGFSDSVSRLAGDLVEKDLLSAVGPIGRRQRHPVMDTDSERDHEFFFIMSFRDKAQCDKAVAEMYKSEQPLDGIHKAVYGSILDPVFICWEDV